ncbi:hypothetical protein [Rhodococcus sp. H29-C3]|uniref:hypothetical protein n=1 Tax=Rhodococcus sp. H29-C3 TaxID=3046307 RepID=UPI0024BA1C0E|nr:hypothetical protein [Rhodococcus sp. H29-C3]MDJ0361853.1 hypothetical protein [Rhodococcus sp. H29-C3]
MTTNSPAYGALQPDSQTLPHKPWVIASLASSLAIVVGSLGPWATIFAFTKNGMEGDGAVTIFLGGLAALISFAVLLRNGRPMVGDRFVNPVIALVVVVVAFYDVGNIGSVESDFMGTTISPSVGWGLWLMLVGALVLLVSSILVAVKAKALR